MLPVFFLIEKIHQGKQYKSVGDKAREKNDK